MAELVTPSARNRSEFIEECKSGKFDGVLVICDRGPSSVATTGKYDDELIQVLPKSLKYICHSGESRTEATPIPFLSSAINIPFHTRDECLFGLLQMERNP